MLSERIVLSILGVVVGFALSQSIALVKYLIRPRFHIIKDRNGVISTYTGNVPEEDAEVVVGFQLENKGWSVARDIRVFINEVRCWNDAKSRFEESASDPFEIYTRQDILLPRKRFTVPIARFTTSNSSMTPFLAQEPCGYDDASYLQADTRDVTKFELDVWIICEDRTAYSESLFRVEFDRDHLNPVYLSNRELDAALRQESAKQP